MNIHLRRFIKNRKNQFIVLVLILCLTFINFFIIARNEDYFSEEFSKYQGVASYLKGTAVMSKIKGGVEENPVKRDKLLKIGDYTEEMYGYTTSIVNFYKRNLEGNTIDEKEKIRFLENKIKLNEKIISGIDLGYIDDYYYNLVDRNKEELLEDIIFDEYLLKNMDEYNLNPYEVSGINSLNYIFSEKFIGILMFLFLLFFTDIFTKDMSEGSYKITYLQPKPRKILILKKFYKNYKYSLITFIILLIFNYLIISFLFDIGNGNKNILLSRSLFQFIGYDEPVFIKLWMFILIRFLLFIFISFMGALGILMFSILTAGYMTGIILSALFIAIGNSYSILTDTIQSNIDFHQIVILNPYESLFFKTIIRNYKLLGLLISLAMGIILSFIFKKVIKVIIARKDFKDLIE